MSIYRIRVKLIDPSPSTASQNELLTIPTLVEASSLVNATAVITALNLQHYKLIGVDLTMERFAVGS